jgi:hypothetical protein
MMTVEEIRQLKCGDLVRALIPVSGGVCLSNNGDSWGGEIEVQFPVGAIGTVRTVEHLGDLQGWGVHISFDNGIDNVFDEGDHDAFQLERVEDTPELRRQRVVFLSRYSPPDYPVEEMLNDMARVLKVSTPIQPPMEKAHVVNSYRVMIRGMVTGVLVVEAENEPKAEHKAERWVRQSRSFQIEGDCEGVLEASLEWTEVEGLE